MIALAATFTWSGYELHGKRFLEDFIRHWPKHRLYVYPERFKLESPAENIIVRDLYKACPTLVEFKSRHNGNPGAHGRFGKNYYYTLDAVKWSHRIFALKAAMDAGETDILVNIDTDIKTFQDIPEGFIESILGDADIAYMPRPGAYSECSLVIYRMSPAVKNFINAHVKIYEEDAIFELPGWTDCHAFDYLVRQFGLKFKDINEGIPLSTHPFVNGPLGAYMDHLKGPRKEEGKSRPDDFVVSRGEAYWRM